jgi:hypothetical protein
MNKFDWFYLRNAHGIVMDRRPKLKYSKWAFMLFAGVPALLMISPKTDSLFVLGASSMSVFASHYLYVMVKYRVIIGGGTCSEYDPKSILDFLCYWPIICIMGLGVIIANAAGLTALFRYFAE